MRTEILPNISNAQGETIKMKMPDSLITYDSTRPEEGASKFCEKKQRMENKV
jgi:hypothetical protein